MITRSSRTMVLLLAIALLLTACGGGGVRVGELQTESQTVELGGATSVRVEIEMAAGELDVSGGAAELLEASFTYNVAEMKPEVEYGGGTLSVRTPDVEVRGDSLWDLDDYRYEWDLRLNDDVPMEMRVNMGAGRADLNLGSLSLSDLSVSRGAGELLVDLSGSASPSRLDIGGGLGKRTLVLPADVGVRVQVDVGVGTVDAAGLTKEGEYYTNDAYGQSDVTLQIEVGGGVGETELRLGE